MGGLRWFWFVVVLWVCSFYCLLFVFVLLRWVWWWVCCFVGSVFVGCLVYGGVLLVIVVLFGLWH